LPGGVSAHCAHCSGQFGRDVGYDLIGLGHALRDRSDRPLVFEEEPNVGRSPWSAAHTEFADRRVGMPRHSRHANRSYPSVADAIEHSSASHDPGFDHWERTPVCRKIRARALRDSMTPQDETAAIHSRRLCQSSMSASRSDSCEDHVAGAGSDLPLLATPIAARALLRTASCSIHSAVPTGRRNIRNIPGPEHEEFCGEKIALKYAAW